MCTPITSGNQLRAGRNSPTHPECDWAGTDALSAASSVNHVAMTVMPSATPMGPKLFDVLQVSNCTGNFAFVG